jgi:hypothetical protein
MPLDAIITSVQSKIAALTSCPNVHDYVRITATEVGWKQLFFDAAFGRVRAYTVTVESSDSQDQTVKGVKDLHLIVIRQYMGVDDADSTEKTFRIEGESVRTFFRGDRRLKDGGNNPIVFWCQPMKRRTQAWVTFGQVLCHYAELTMVVEEYPL